MKKIISLTIFGLSLACSAAAYTTQLQVGEATSVTCTGPSPMPIPTVTLTPAPIPGPTITVTPSPLPAVTLTPLPLPAVTVTVTPAPLPAVTITPEPLPAVTITPSPLPAVTITPSPIPAPTVTVTTTPAAAACPSPTPLPSPSPSPTPLPSPRPSPSASPLVQTNFSHIKTALVAYGIDGYTASLKPTVMAWLAKRYDYIIGGGVDPRVTNPNDNWTSYADSAFVYSNEIYDIVKTSAITHAFFYEDALLHTSADYQVGAGFAWSNLSQFDAFEQPPIQAGPGNPTSAINGTFLLSGTTYTDVTASAYDKAHHITISDQILLGYAEPFDQVNFTVSTPGSKAVQWQYWNGAWTNLTNSDGTSNLSQSGKMSFTPPADWRTSSVNGSRVKYWVKAVTTGAGIAPVVTQVFGDDWIAHTASNNCRGWNATDSNRINVGLGNLEYNPTPPSTATAKFRYQARSTGIWASNANFGNVGNFQGTARTWASVLVDRVSALHPSAAAPNGVMFDDGLAFPNFISSSASVGGLTDMGAGTWADNGTSMYSEVAAKLHALFGPAYKVGANATSQTYANIGDWALDELTINTTSSGEVSIAPPRAGGEQTYDGFLAATNPVPTAGIMTTWSNSNFGYNLGTNWFGFDQANRGPIDALAGYYIAANPNTYFTYNTFGWRYYETDEYYYWSSPTATTAILTMDTSTATKQIVATDVSAFAKVPLYATVVIKVGGNGEVFHANKINATTLTTIDPIHFSYPVGTAVSYAIASHQSTDTLPPLTNIWKWGPWFPAIGVDIGSPDPSGLNGGARNLSWVTGPAASGDGCTSGSGCGEIWRRDYTKAIVLSRVIHWNIVASEISAYSVPIPLGATYYPLSADGKTGPAVTSIQLRAGESAILLKAPL